MLVVILVKPINARIAQCILHARYDIVRDYEVVIIHIILASIINKEGVVGITLRECHTHSR